MDLEKVKTKSSILQNKDKYLQYFRENFHNLKTNKGFKKYCDIYLSFLTPDDKQKDMYFDHIMFVRKIERMETREKNYKELIAEQYVCINGGIDSMYMSYRKEYSVKVKSIKSLCSVTFDKKNTDQNNSETLIKLYRNELNLNLEDKWMTDIYTSQKQEFLKNLNILLKKYLDSSIISDINTISKAKHLENLAKKAAININVSADVIFKKPDIPMKSKNNTPIESSSGSNSIEKSLLNRNTNVKNTNIESSESKDSDTFEDKTGIITSEKFKVLISDVENLTNTNRTPKTKYEGKCTDKLCLKNKIDSIVSEDLDFKKSDNTIIRLIDQNTLKNEFFKEKPMAESTEIDKNKPIQTSDPKKSHINEETLKNYFEKGKPLAESTGIDKDKPIQTFTTKGSHVDQDTLKNDFRKGKPMAESTGINKKNQINQCMLKNNFFKAKPLAESTGIDKDKPIQTSGPKRSHINQKNLKNDFAKRKPLAESTAIDKDKPIKTFGPDRSDADQDTLRSDLIKEKPFAESTCINKEKLIQTSASNHFDLDTLKNEFIKVKPIAESTGINKEIPIQINDHKPIQTYGPKRTYIDQDISINFHPGKPIAESTGIDKKNKIDKGTLKKDFRKEIPIKDLKSKPIAERINNNKENSNENIYIDNIDKNCNDKIIKGKLLNSSIRKDDLKTEKHITENTSIQRDEIRYIDDNLEYFKDLTIDGKHKTTTIQNSSLNKYLSVNEKCITTDMMCNSSTSNASSSIAKSSALTPNPISINTIAKENIPYSTRYNDDNNLPQLSSILKDLKIEYLENDFNDENVLNLTKIDVSESQFNHSSSFPIIGYSPWDSEVQTKWWESVLKILLNSKDVSVFENEHKLLTKVTFQSGSQFNTFSINTKNKLKNDNFSAVYLAQRDNDNRMFVIKILNSKMCIEYYIVKYIFACFKASQLSVDTKLSICSMSNLLITSTKSFILMPLYSKGNLLDLSALFQKHNYKMENIELLTAYLAIELIITIFNLHQIAHVIHCDIKPDNIMINNNFPLLNTDFQMKKTKVITFIDFGRAINLDRFTPNCAFTTRGSPKGLECVEMVKNKPWRYQIDLFNIATTLYVLLQNNYPRIVERNNRFVFSHFKNFRNLRASEIWLNLFDVLINVESINYPDITIFVEDFTNFIKQNINDYNNMVGRINTLLN